MSVSSFVHVFRIRSRTVGPRVPELGVVPSTGMDQVMAGLTVPKGPSKWGSI